MEPRGMYRCSSEGVPLQDKGSSSKEHTNKKQMRGKKVGKPKEENIRGGNQPKQASNVFLEKGVSSSNTVLISQRFRCGFMPIQLFMGKELRTVNTGLGRG